jgi:EmrB/QacA subfamily drug resistance transporter
MGDAAGQRSVGRRPASPRAVLAVVGFAVFVAADDLTVVATMLRPIIGDLGLTLPDGLDEAAWIVNAYLIAFVAVMPIAGRVSDIVGRRRTFLAAYSLFIVGTIIIPTASSLGPFLFGRVLTAIGGGAMVPVALAVVGDVYPDRPRALGILGSIETLGWVWGPLYGAMLVRFLSWQWQFWLNVPLAVIGMAAAWYVLADHDRPQRLSRVDWLGGLLVTIFLVSLNLALLGNAEIQSVTGLDELTGGSGPDLRWLYAVALVAAAAFVWHQRRALDPLIDPRLFGGRNVRLALLANLVVGAALVIAMVDIPIFINAVEVDLERAALVSGWVLSVLTASMAVTAYVGGRLTERTWYGPPVVAGLVAATLAYLTMGFVWDGDTSYALIAVQLAVLGAGFGLTVAPTNSAVIAGAPADHRGAAAALVMVTRLLGFSIGLSALTAWGLARFNSLRGDIDLPPLTDPGFESALRDASEELTAKAIAETFLATAVVTVIGVGAAMAMRRQTDAPDEIDVADRATGEPSQERPIEQTGVAMTSWLNRHLGLVLGAFALLLVGAFVWIAILMSQVRETRHDLDRVEAGAAIFASQVQGFQDKVSELAPNVSAGLDEAITGLESFGSSTVEFNVPIDEDVKFATSVVIDREIEVPIKTTLPIDESFDTTIKVAGPFGIDIPLDVTVPVNIDVPIDLTITVPIHETVPIDANVPVKLDIPINVDVSETQLAELSKALAAGLRSFQEILEGLAG